MVSTTLSTRVSSLSTSTTPAMEGEKKHPYPTTEVTSAPYNHLDENAVALELASNPTHPITAADTTRVLRKIDLYLMPLMCLAVLLQFLDKTSLNYASLLGLKKDTHLHGQQYSWLGSFFYVGYLIATPVHGYFLQKFSLSRYVGVNIVLWAIALGAHAACRNYPQLVVVRLTLGWAEAALTPALVLLTGRFYTKREQVVRTSVWFANNGWAQILGGGISYALQVQNQGGKLRVWQQLYLILAGIAFLFGFIVLAFMPDSPATIRYLTTRERQIAVHRIRSNKSGIHDKKFKKNQLIEAVKDFRLYLFFVAICAANIANGGVSNFGSEIISQFGYDSKTTSLLGMAPGAMEVVAVYFGAWLSHVTHTRVIPGVLMYILAIVGGVMMIAIPSTSSAGRYSGYVICFTYPVASPFIYSFLSSSVSGTTKRIVFNMVLQVGYSVGNLIGPQTYRVKDAPGFVPAKITLVVVFGVAAACLVWIGGVHARWNRRNGLGGCKDVVSAGEDGIEGEEEGKREVDDGEDLSDLTDKQRSRFRYPY
ncbi:hypothetical protein NDA10_006628 [Ustilago hordei]|nr:hypothetical protein NDA10_006628 [Ustilago hordei]